ncbi:MAG: efflux RND transporter periplasmic adaptor subunit [Fuerstiella sp.]|jgi:multidrug resistance efflux pump|nr:efflux RND transporter periplasmic adaptor subunit [Fuerstiella sp.]
MKLSDLALYASLLILTTGMARAADEFDDPNNIGVDEARIEIKDQVEVSVEIPGTITKLIPNNVGGVVEKGQLVIQLDDELVRAQLAETEEKARSEILIKFAEIKLEEAKVDLKDKEDRNKITPGLFSDTEIRRLILAVEQGKAELQKSKHDKLLAELAAKTKEKELRQFTRHAELSGIVTDLHKKAVGAAVRQGDPIMTIVNLDYVLAVLQVSSNFEDRVNVGDKVLIRRHRNTGTKSSGGAFKTPVENSAPRRDEPQQPVSNVIFTGEVTLISPSLKTDKEASLEIRAIIRNQSPRPGVHSLKEGAPVDAVILSP